jgi:DMSO/TMAO reductase YedYZ heme-binding membrane subunit
VLDLLNTHSPILWFLNRSTGVVLLVLLTASIVLGCLGAGRNAGGRVPAFAVHHLHRNLSVMALVLTAVHVTTAVADSYVDIRWWQAFSPIGATYRPLWFDLGVVASDLMILLAVTTWARRRLGHRAWHAVHLLGYLTWPLALAHGAGIGTDGSGPVGLWTAAGCTAAVVLAVLARLRRATQRRAVPRRASLPGAQLTGRAS